MKLLSPTPTLRALPRATLLSASSENKFLLAASSTTVFTTPFHRSHFLVRGVTGHAPRRSFGAPQIRPFPQLNLHKARVRRNHGRPPPNGFTGRAQNSPPPFTPHRKRASGKALALFRKSNLSEPVPLPSLSCPPIAPLPNSINLPPKHLTP